MTHEIYVCDYTEATFSFVNLRGKAASEIIKLI